VVPKPAPPGRVRNIVLDVLALPVVFAGPRRRVRALDASIPMHYDFGQWTWRTERMAEIALARYALARSRAANVLEVGNVLALAGIAGHTVLDKYEAGPGVLNEDIVDYRPQKRFDLAISISTVEHIGFDEHPQEPGKAARALEHVGELADRLLITIPVGYNHDAEVAVLNGPFDRVELLVKTSRLGIWEQRELGGAANVRYGMPYAYGNGILVGSRRLTAK